MKGYTQATIAGNITKDLELRTTQSGKSVTTLTVAVNRGEDTSFIDAVAWNQAAETLTKYLSKGSPVILGGELNQRSWETDGVKHQKIELVVRSFTFIGNKSDEPITQAQVLEKARDVAPEDVDESVSLDDIPF